ncbi:MAG: transglutaminase domain-containing protein [Pseudomonadota bacterium]
MLAVATDPSASPRFAPSPGPSRWRLLAWISLALLVAALGSLAPYLLSSTELVRLRNAALLASAEPVSGFDWSPHDMPVDFQREEGPADAVYLDATRQLDLAALPSDWDRVLAISAHLLSHPQLVGTPIQSDLRDTYRRILRDGTGYCGDFTRVFMALGLASGMQVRAWSFSLDGFGGHGHIWPEVWNRQLGQWQLVDIFNNAYFVAADGVPLSALALRQAMLQSSEGLRLVPLVSDARPGYEMEAKAWDYYRRGLLQWYLSWGNNVFSYDRALLVRSLNPWSRALEQLGAVAQGVYPRIHILGDPGNTPQVAALLRLRQHLVLVTGVVGLALLVLAISVIGGWLALPRGVRKARP